MKNDSIKKYLIPNIPYLFVLWAFLKLGTAYRLAAGADFAHKLMGLREISSSISYTASFRLGTNCLEVPLPFLMVFFSQLPEPLL